MLIFVKTLVGRTLTIHIDATDTVRDLKVKINELVGIPPDCQNLVFCGKPLIDRVAISTPVSLGVVSPPSSPIQVENGQRNVEFLAARSFGSKHFEKSIFLPFSPSTPLHIYAECLALGLSNRVGKMTYRCVKFILGDHGVREVKWTSAGVERGQAKLGDFLCYDRPIVVLFEEAYESCRISNECTVHMVLKLRGGGGGGGNHIFSDVTNDKGLVTRPWSSLAPKWRVVRAGLCIEGVCKNSNCDAYRKMVICTLGHSNFDLIKDAESDKCKCPICHEKFEPVTAGFNNCLWRVSAVKADSNDGSIFHKPWSRADDSYTRYDPGTSGTACFSRLQIYVRDSGPPDNTCAICLESVSSFDASQPAGCSHTFHQLCLRMVDKCPICRCPAN